MEARVAGAVTCPDASWPQRCRRISGAEQLAAIKQECASASQETPGNEPGSARNGDTPIAIQAQQHLDARDIPVKCSPVNRVVEPCLKLVNPILGHSKTDMEL